VGFFCNLMNARRAGARGHTEE